MCDYGLPYFAQIICLNKFVHQYQVKIKNLKNFKFSVELTVCIYWNRLDLFWLKEVKLNYGHYLKIKKKSSYFEL